MVRVFKVVYRHPQTLEITSIDFTCEKSNPLLMRENKMLTKMILRTDKLKVAADLMSESSVATLERLERTDSLSDRPEALRSLVALLELQ